MEGETVTLGDERVRTEVTLDELAEEIGDQYILDTDEPHPEFGYLAALALETYEDGNYDINRTLREFINNCAELEVENRDDVVELL